MIQKGGGGGGVSNSSYVTTKGTGVTSDPFLQAQSSSGLLDSYYSSRARPRALNGKVTLDETGETDPYWSEEKRHFTYEPHHDRSNKENGIIATGVQEEGRHQDSMLVHVSVNSNIRSSVKESRSPLTPRKICEKCYIFPLCGWLVISILIMGTFWVGFVLIELLPSMAGDSTIIYKDTIVLLARADPFWYSSVKARKVGNDAGHLLQVYALECSSMVEENYIIRYNRSLLLRDNALLLGPTFLTGGSTFDFTVQHLNVQSNDRILLQSSVVIFNSIDTLDAFRRNESIKPDDMAYTHNISSANDQFSFTTSETGYFYVGFKPGGGEVSVQISYVVLGYKYARPTLAYSTCSTQQSGSSCTVALPSSLANLDSDYYCVLGEVDSNPSWDDQNKLQVSLKVHRGRWNMFTIAIFLVCVIATSCGMILHLVCCIRFLRQKCHRIRDGYSSIQ